MISSELTPEEALEALKKSLSSVEFVLDVLNKGRTTEKPAKILYHEINNRLILVEDFLNKGSYKDKSFNGINELVAAAKEAISKLEASQEKPFE